MSMERQVRRALWRVVLWRLAGDCVSLPRRVLETVATWLEQLELAVFYVELDAARRYELLTSVDLGAAARQEQRYEGLRGGS